MIGQLMVVMFLFYSGYGILESYKSKKQYKDKFLKKRFLKTLFNFDIAVLLFIILSFALNQQYYLKEYLLSLIAWDTVGNSNWFVFDILILYLITLLCLYVFSQKQMPTIVGTVYGLTTVLLIVLYFTKTGSYWYDTVLAFPTGMLFSLYKQRFEYIFRKNINFFLSLIASLIVFAILMKYGQVLGTLINGMLFPLIVVMITTRVKIDNKVLRWLGLQCFAVYILQRLPMIVFTEMGFNDNWILFSIAVIPTTLFLASLFTAFTNKTNKKIFR